MSERLLRLLSGCAALALAAGCAAAGTSSDRSSPAPGAARELDAAALRAAAVTDAELPAGWTVALMHPAQDGTGGDLGGDTGPETADVPACQPVLDAVAPGKSASGPLAEADLTASRAADPRGSVYAGLLAFRAGRAEKVQAELEQVLANCGAFGSAAKEGPRAAHRLARADTPTPEGADAATAFTLTSEVGGSVLAQRALMVRSGTVLAVFTTVASGKDPAPEPDPALVRAQLAKVRAAQH